MNFFKSVFSTDPEPSDPANESDSSRDQEQQQEEDDEEEEAEAPENLNPNPSSPSYGGGGGGGSGGGAWGLRFGGLIKTIASRSESVIETYRRDLEEFSTGLKKETSVFKEVASRAVRDLPVSLEAGASVAQESLETVGQAIDDFGGSVWRGTADIISHGKDALLSIDNDNDSFSQDPNEAAANPQTSKRYSRFEAQVLAIQNDANTFVEEPEDAGDFEKWMAGFRMEEKEEEMEGLLYDNGTLEGFFDEFVPDVVDQETFWGRYFYRVYRLKQAEDARAKLVKRVIAGEEEEELSWEVDDSDESEDEVKEEKKEGGGKIAESEIAGIVEKKPIEEVVESSEKNEEEAMGEVVETSEKPKEEVMKEEVVESSESVEEKKPVEATQVENVEEVVKPKEEVMKEEVVESVEEKKPVEATQVENVEEVVKVKTSDENDSTLKMEDKLYSEPKSEPGESGKDSDFSVIASQPSIPEEDDLGWDEIEDLGEHEDKKAVCSSGSPKKVDLRKRLSVAEDDEDLSWDIEDDDDEPVKP